MIEELKPCPFCGGKVSIAKMGGKRYGYKWFATRLHGDSKCICRLFMESEPFPVEADGASEKAELIRRWNHRVEAEYNNGWIPVSERLPEEHEESKDMYDYDEHGGIMETEHYMTSELVLVTVRDNEKGELFTNADNTADGKWCCFCGRYEVLAWQPLPEGYKPKVR